MQYKCPHCQETTEVQIVRTYPPRILKCSHCGFAGPEDSFEVRPASKVDMGNKNGKKSAPDSSVLDFSSPLHLPEGS